MRGNGAFLLILGAIGCSGSNFDVVNAQDSEPVSDSTTEETSADSTVDSMMMEDTTPEETSMVDSTMPDTMMPLDTTVVKDTLVADTIAIDTAPIDTGPPCIAVAADTKDVYVDASAPAGGKGSLGCPFNSLKSAASAPLGATDRVVHVKTGTYAETELIAVRSRETYRGEGGAAKLISSNTTVKCVTDTCAMILAGGAVVESFSVEGTATAFGIVTNASDGASPIVRNTVVKNAMKDGIAVFANGATLGPNAHSESNGWSGVSMRGPGKLVITGSGNGFDNNKGTGALVGSEWAYGAGIFMSSGQLSMEGSATANGNQNGLEFSRDLLSANTLMQTVNQLTAQRNRFAGVVVNKNWNNVTIRSSVLTNNDLIGLLLTYPSTKFELGTSPDAGNNVFGGATVNNKRVGIMMCNSGATGSQPAFGNKWTQCPPVQTSLGDCTLLPGSYVDVAYQSDSSVPVATKVDPINAGGCTVGE